MDIHNGRMLTNSLLFFQQINPRFLFKNFYFIVVRIHSMKSLYLLFSLFFCYLFIHFKIIFIEV